MASCAVYPSTRWPMIKVASGICACARLSDRSFREFLDRMILGAAILVVVIGGVMLAAAILRGTLGSQALAKQIGTVITQSLLDPGSTRLKFEDVTGNPLTGLEL